ncbi:hypothetical protein BDY24DRAFT_440838 [Mrakia frigida]|uniref:uncharacterized protein n=1 Tax=Mrakia frigida TaxID=29902 RepID=UPI003FCC0AD7
MTEGLEPVFIRPLARSERYWLSLSFFDAATFPLIGIHARLTPSALSAYYNDKPKFTKHLETAIVQLCVRRPSLLFATFLNTRTLSPSIGFLPSIDLQTRLVVSDEKVDGLPFDRWMENVVSDGAGLMNSTTKEGGGEPIWKVVVRFSSSSPEEVFVGMVVHHAVSDGLSTLGLVRDLFKILNEPTTTTTANALLPPPPPKIVHLPSPPPPFPPPLEHVLSTSYLTLFHLVVQTLLSDVVYPFLPSFLKPTPVFIGQPSTRLFPIPSTTTTTSSNENDSSFPSFASKKHLSSIHLPPPILDALLLQSRAQGVTLTSLLHVLVCQTLQPLADKAGGGGKNKVMGLTAISLRPFVVDRGRLIEGTEEGQYVGEIHHVVDAPPPLPLPRVGGGGGGKEASERESLLKGGREEDDDDEEAEEVWPWDAARLYQSKIRQPSEIQTAISRWDLLRFVSSDGPVSPTKTKTKNGAVSEPNLLDASSSSSSFVQTGFDQTFLTLLTSSTPRHGTFTLSNLGSLSLSSNPTLNLLLLPLRATFTETPPPIDAALDVSVISLEGGALTIVLGCEEGVWGAEGRRGLEGIREALERRLRAVAAKEEEVGEVLRGD